MDPKTWEEEGHKVMGSFMNMLRLSGYDAKYRHQILVGVLGRRLETEKEIRAGTRVRYREAEEIQRLKSEDKQGHINTWFLRGEVTSMLQVQATPNWELARKIQRRISGMRAPWGDC